MTRHPRGVLCDRARGWAALAPDGELSELERKLLGSHLDRCASCSSFALEVSAVATQLRDATLQRLSRPVSVPVWRRRHTYARIRTVGAAAAVAVMALGVAARAPLPSSEQGSSRLPQVTNFANSAPAREVELINRRADNEQANKTHFRPRTLGSVTRPI